MLMTIKDLYKWAVLNGAENLDLKVRDFSGSYTYNITPEVDITTNNDGSERKEVSL